MYSHFTGFKLCCLARSISLDLDSTSTKKEIKLTFMVGRFCFRQGLRSRAAGALFAERGRAVMGVGNDIDCVAIDDRDLITLWDRYRLLHVQAAQSGYEKTDHSYGSIRKGYRQQGHVARTRFL